MKSRLTMMLLAICTTALAQYSVPNLDPRVTVIESTLPQKVSTNDAGRQLNWAGADVRVADGTETNHPVTKAQLDGLLPASPVAGDLVKYDGTNWVATAKTWLEEDTVVYFYPTNTFSEIQATINALPRNLNGKVLYLAFNNGTYNFNNTLYVRDFFGGILYWGTTSLTYSSLSVAYTNQPIIFQNDGLINPTIVHFENCPNLKIYDSKFYYSDAHTNKYCIQVINCSVQVSANMFAGSSTNETVNMSGLLSHRSIFDLRANYLHNLRVGLYLQRGSIAGISAHVSGPIRPAYDIVSSIGSIVGVNQTGLTVHASAGGLVIKSNGAILP